MYKPTLVICAFVLFLGSTITASPITSEMTGLQTKGLVDFVISSFGLQDVWDLIQHVGINATAPLVEMLTQILFQGQTAITQAKQVIAKLVNTLKSSSVGGAQAIAQAVSDLAAIIAGNPNKRVHREFNRGLLDYALNLFGLQDSWSTIQQMGAQVSVQFLNDLFSIILMGKDAIDLAKPIIAKMVKDLKDHGVGQFQIVFQTISDLAAIIAGNPNQKETSKALLGNSRGLFDYVINLFGLSDVWTAVQGAGTNLVATLLNELLQIMLKGQGAIELAKPIISNMIKEIKDHSIGKVQAVAQAISDLAAILAGNPNSRAVVMSRGLFDYVINFFGLGDIWSTIQGAGSDLVSKLLNELVQIIMAGKGLVEQAKPIIAKLVEELKSHSMTSVQAVSEAISDLAAILTGNPPSTISPQ